jgi:putative sterol carrier protein
MRASDFSDLLEGKADVQKLYMSGRLKVKGQYTAVAKLQAVFQDLVSLGS